MIASPALEHGGDASTVFSVISPAGTITQTARGALSFEASSSSEEAPSAPSPASVVDRVGVDVVDDAAVAVAHQPAGHVGAHPAEPDHSEFHARPLPRLRAPDPMRRTDSLRDDGCEEASARPARPTCWSIFGITGDLAKKMTFRALYRLEARGKLDCPIVGVAIDDWDDEQLREHAREAIVDHASRTPTRTSSPASPSASPTSRATTPTPTTFERVGEAIGDARAAGLLPRDPALAVRRPSSTASARPG